MWRLSYVFALLVLVATVVARPASAQPPPGAAARVPPQGVAVIGVGNAREEAFTAARAVYASSIRPRALDEVRARVLAGDPPPPTSSREVRDLAEVRAGIHGDDAASRQLLGTIAQRTNVRAILVISVDARPAEAAPADPSASADRDAGPGAGAAPADGGASTGTSVSGKLYLAESADFDAARYTPEPGMSGAAAWRATVTSLERRFPAPAAPPAVATGPAPTVRPAEGKESKPFYTSPWFWGGLGAAVLLGGVFYFASQDSSDEPIHLEMRVPR
jgi:hypothetical protein